MLILEKALFRKEKKTLAEVQSLKTSVEVRGGIRGRGTCVPDARGNDLDSPFDMPRFREEEISRI